MSIELGEFQKLCEEMYAKSAECDVIEAQLKAQCRQLEALKAKVLAYMEQSEIENFKVTGHGSVYIKTTSSVKVPKEDKDRDAFFAYLRDRGIFEQSITVHSQTLNALYKATLAEAKEKGDMSFKFPGIEAPSFYKTLVLRST